MKSGASASPGSARNKINIRYGEMDPSLQKTSRWFSCLLWTQCYDSSTLSRGRVFCFLLQPSWYDLFDLLLSADHLERHWLKSPSLLKNSRPSFLTTGYWKASLSHTKQWFVSLTSSVTNASAKTKEWTRSPRKYTRIAALTMRYMGGSFLAWRSGVETITKTSTSTFISAFKLLKFLTWME